MTHTATHRDALLSGARRTALGHTLLVLAHAVGCLFAIAAVSIRGGNYTYLGSASLLDVALLTATVAGTAGVAWFTWRQPAPDVWHRPFIPGGLGGLTVYGYWSVLAFGLAAGHDFAHPSNPATFTTSGWLVAVPVLGTLWGAAIVFRGLNLYSDLAQVARDEASDLVYRRLAYLPPRPATS